MVSAQHTVGTLSRNNRRLSFGTKLSLICVSNHNNYGGYRKARFHFNFDEKIKIIKECNMMRQWRKEKILHTISYDNSCEDSMLIAFSLRDLWPFL